MEQATSPVTAAPSTAVPPRMRGIDMARGIAIIGMAMVHIGPQELPGGGWLGAAYRAAHGRSAILFIVLAGLGVSLLAGDRSASRLESATWRLWWRALVLLPIGLALQSLPTNVAVILQYYAVYFVIASGVMRLGDRMLLTVGAAGLTVGPAVILWLHHIVPTWFEPGVPRWNDSARIVRDILLTGFYPAAVWIAPLALGIWIGRRDLRTAHAGRRLLLCGAAAAAAGFVVSDVLVGALGRPASDTDWRLLAVVEPHNEMPLWLVTSSGIAVAVIGACVLLALRLPRVVWPMVAFGQLALSTYILHLLVLAWQPDWLLRDEFVPAWIAVARFAAVAIVLTTIYRLVAPQGPFEWLLRLPGRRMGRVTAGR